MKETTGITTEALRGQTAGPRVRAIRVRLVGTETSFNAPGHGSSIGSHPSNAIQLEQSTVSRFHCELFEDERGLAVRDLESTNGTVLDGVGVREGYLKHGSSLVLGRAQLSIEFCGDVAAAPCSPRCDFGSLVGVSTSMRQLFHQLERAAESDATVLISGETGTGKEAAAEAIHANSKRADRPFVVIDLSAIHPNLMESELFGHERGAFTGAVAARPGAFEEAEGGTVFLDELGELPLDLQPRLLRVLEKREIRRVGQNEYRPVDVRVVAATHRDLRTLANQGTFRPDLYYRLAVIGVRLPALREHPEDLPLIGARILDQLGVSTENRAAFFTESLIARLRYASWPGNVRELRNYLERCCVLGELLPFDSAAPEGRSGATVDDSVASYHEARKNGIAQWERNYLSAVLARHGPSSLAAVARAIGIDRHYFYRLLRRHGLDDGDRDK